LVTVPAVNVAVDETVIEVLETMLATVITPEPNEPVPAVAVIIEPTTSPVVADITVIVAVYGPAPETVPIVPVVLIIGFTEFIIVPDVSATERKRTLYIVLGLSAPVAL